MSRLLNQILIDIQRKKNKKINKSLQKDNTTTAVPVSSQNYGSTRDVVESSIENTNGIGIKGGYLTYSAQNINNVSFENPINTSPDVFDIINKYRGTLKYTISIGQGPPNEIKGSSDRGTKTTDVNRIIYNTVAAPSIFNPYYGIQAVGITANVPLLDTQQNNDEVSAIHSVSYSKDKSETVLKGKVALYETNDCSISNLVKLSKEPHNRLGHARYKYTDFMYCAEVGKISNNHLITLRRFNTPVGDNIFEETTLDDSVSNLQIYSDIGRMVTWFGTEDNRLEDILRYSYSAKFKTLEAKIDSKDSEESASERGIMGGLVNLFSPGYNAATGRGVAPSALALILGTGGSDAFLSSAPYASNPAVNGSTYDKNRIYEPQDTIRSVEVPEGILEFSNEFTLTFNYKLRGYDNINAKTAMLDLLANILVVTYKTGTFWQGEQRIIGAPPNPSGWQKVESFKNDTFAAGGTFIGKLMNGGNFGDAANSLLAGLSSAVSNNFGIDLSEVLSNPGEAIKNLTQEIKDAGFGTALKGLLSNAMGRPAVYAFDSLLSGDNTGLWHVTIGNPLNPIAVLGNLILTNAEISHSGPLGLDDFPTDLKVVVTLKHARPRDSVDIQRMYTMGRTAIYGKIGKEENYNFSGFDNVSVKTTSTKATDKTSTTVETTTNATETEIINSNTKFESSESIGWLGESVKARFISNLHRLK